MKEKILIPLMLLFSLALVGVVSATDTAVITANDWVSYDEVVYVNFTFDDENKNCTDINWTISDGTTTYHIHTNTTTADFGWNNTLSGMAMNVSGLSDDLGADAYTITAECFNSSGVSLGSDTELVGIDNTIPTCSQSTLASNTEYDLTETTTLTVTCTNASGSTATFGGNTYSLTESSDVCTLDISTIPATGYDIGITTTDGLNTTSCTSLTSVILKKPSSGGKSVVIPNTGSIVVGDKVVPGTNFIKSFFDWIMSLFK